MQKKRKTPINLYIETDIADIIDEMRDKGIVPSHFVEKVIREFKKNKFKYPLTIGESETII